jgi:dihydroflavonol-4-reductase
MMFASSAKAERELGLRMMSVENSLRLACAWFVENGYAPAPPTASAAAMS